MHDPTPVQCVAGLFVVALGWLALWWVGLPPPTRLQLLEQIAAVEQAAVAPPEGLWAQGEWLATHRASWLGARVGLVGVVVLIGACEGSARRRGDVRGGLLYWWWTVGVVGLALGGLLGLALCVYPWPLRDFPVLPGLAGVCGVSAYGLGAGRPYIA